MKGYLAALLLVLPFVVAIVPAVSPSTRTIDITLSRDAFSPRQIEVRLGERVRLNLTSTDGAHGFEVKELGLNARIPAGGETVTLDLTPTDPGTFDIKSSDECGDCNSGIIARLVVTDR